MLLSNKTNPDLLRKTLFKRIVPKGRTAVGVGTIAVRGRLEPKVCKHLKNSARRVFLLYGGVNKAKKNWKWRNGMKGYCDGIVDQRIFYPETSLVIGGLECWFRLWLGQSSETWGKEKVLTKVQLQGT